jgi:hypothetical protein
MERAFGIGTKISNSTDRVNTTAIRPNHKLIVWRWCQLCQYQIGRRWQILLDTVSMKQ